MGLSASAELLVFLGVADAMFEWWCLIMVVFNAMFEW